MASVAAMLAATATAQGTFGEGMQFDGRYPECVPWIVQEQTETQPEIREGPCGPYNIELLLKGERHCSTNFFGGILEYNLGHDFCRDAHGQCCLSASMSEICSAGVNEPTPTTYCCWKHGYPNADCPYANRQPDQPYPVGAFIARSPYPWLLSMYHTPYEYFGGTDNNTDMCGDDTCTKSMTFSEFLRARFDYRPSVNRDGVGYYHGFDMHNNPIALWNAKVFNTTSASGMPGELSGGYHNAMINVSHGDLYNLERLSEALSPLLNWGFSMPDYLNGEFDYPPMCSEADDTGCGDKFGNNITGSEFSLEGFQEASDYDSSGDYFELYSQDDLDYVNNLVNHDLMRRWGFHVVTTKPTPQEHEERRAGLVHTTGVKRNRKAGGKRTVDRALMAERRPKPVPYERAEHAWADAERVKHHMRLLTMVS